MLAGTGLLATMAASVVLRPPVPSGCTLTRVLSSETASILMRTIYSRCSCSKTRSRTLFLDQRFIRI